MKPYIRILALMLTSAAWPATAMALTPMLVEQSACLDGSGNDAVAACTRVVDTGLLQDRALADIYHKRGATWIDLRQYDRAVDDFTQAIRLRPDNPVAFNDRGVTYMKKGDYDRAIADFDQAIGLFPNYGLAIANRVIAVAVRKYGGVVQ